MVLYQFGVDGYKFYKILKMIYCLCETIDPAVGKLKYFIIYYTLILNLKKKCV